MYMWKNKNMGNQRWHYFTDTHTLNLPLDIRGIRQFIDLFVTFELQSRQVFKMPREIRGRRHFSPFKQL